MTGPRPPVVERRDLPGRRYRARPDDAAELRAIADVMADVPRDAVASMPDVFHFLRRLRGRLVVVVDRLELAEPGRGRTPRQRAPTRSPVEARAVADGVFGKAKPVRREKRRTIGAWKGRAVAVVERSSRQMDLGF